MKTIYLFFIFLLEVFCKNVYGRDLITYV